MNSGVLCCRSLDLGRDDVDVAVAHVFESVGAEGLLPADSSERGGLLASEIKQNFTFVVASNGFAPADQIDRRAALVSVDGYAVARRNSGFQHTNELIFHENDVVFPCGDDGIQFWRPS